LLQKAYEKRMEVLFKKAYSNLQQAVLKLDMSDYTGTITNGIPDYFNGLFLQYKIIQSRNVANQYYKTINGKSTINIRTYTGELGERSGCVQLPTKVVADGFSIAALYNCYAAWIIIDTNGQQKPNRYGHDIFIFGFDDSKKEIIPLGNTYYSWIFDENTKYCSKTSTNKLNGATCSYFAVHNTCPDGSAKTYWECLPK
jgi:hypothetical protein